jgi:hypothetical protein
MSNTSDRRNRRKFNDEFKADAVALVEESGGQIAKVAEELGIHDSSLGNWVQYAGERAEGEPTPQERAEIREAKERARAGHARAGHLGKSGTPRGPGIGDCCVPSTGRAGFPRCAGKRDP